MATWLAINATNPGDMVRIPASKQPKTTSGCIM